MGLVMKESSPKIAVPKVFTIGHSTRDFDEVLGMLRANDVTELVDVRSYSSSRKFPQWNQTTIEEALPAGIGYRWIKDLGGRRHTPVGVDSLNGGWRVKAVRDYADYMTTAPFALGSLNSSEPPMNQSRLSCAAKPCVAVSSAVDY